MYQPTLSTINDIPQSEIISGDFESTIWYEKMLNDFIYLPLWCVDDRVRRISNVVRRFLLSAIKYTEALWIFWKTNSYRSKIFNCCKRFSIVCLIDEISKNKFKRVTTMKFCHIIDKINFPASSRANFQMHVSQQNATKTGISSRKLLRKMSI